MTVDTQVNPEDVDKYNQLVDEYTEKKLPLTFTPFSEVKQQETLCLRQLVRIVLCCKKYIVLKSDYIGMCLINRTQKKEK